METSAQQGTRLAEITARIDRLPIARFSYLLLVLLMPAWVIESYDIGIIGATIAVIKTLWTPTAAALGFLAVSSTIAIVVSLVPAGALADRLGRRRLLIGGIVWFSVFTGLAGFSPNLLWLAALRFVAGLGLGAVFPLPYIYLTKFMATRSRAKFVGYLNGLLTAAYVVPPLTAVYLLAHFSHETAWRMLYLIAFVPLVYAVLLYYVLPESPRWLAARGRNDEALKIVERLEADAIRSGKTLEAPQIPVPVAQRAAPSKISTLFRQPLASKAWFAAFVFFGTEPTFYVLLTFAPVLMVAQGFQLAKSLQFVALLQVSGGIGGVVQGLIGDMRGRRPAIMSYAFLSACGLAGLALGHSATLLIIAGVVVGFFGLGIYPVTKLYVAEQFPTAVRGMGAGFAESFGRFFGGVVFVYLVPFLSGIGGTSLIIWLVIAILALTTFIPVALLGRETRGRDVDTQFEESAALAGAAPAHQA